MRIPTMTVETAESELGPRGHLLVNDDNRRVVRKWLVAQGYPAAFAAERTVRELSNAYNETDGTGLAVINRLLKAWKEKQAPVGPVPTYSENVLPDTLGAPINDDAELGGNDESLHASSPDCGIFDQSSEGQAARAESNIPFVTPLPSQPVDKAKALFEILQSIGTLDKDAVEAIVEVSTQQVPRLAARFRRGLLARELVSRFCAPTPRYTASRGSFIPNSSCS